MLKHRLLDLAVGEISRREPGYFRQFPVEIAPLSLTIEDYLSLPLCLGWTESEVAVCIEQSMRYYASIGVTFCRGPGGTDPIARMLLDSAIDAFAAEQDILSLRAPPPIAPSVADVLNDEYDERPIAGRRYFIRRSGTRPLVLINAIGLPCRIWTRLLTDKSHPYRIILVENPATDLIRGGLRTHGDVATDARDIAQVLQKESINDSIVLAWCNGGRVAIQVAATQWGRVHSLVLLSPTFMGFRGVEPPCSSYEAGFDLAFEALAAKPALASLFAQILSRRPEPGWSSADSANVRAELLFRLPAFDHASLLSMPVSDALSLINYARRAKADARFAINETLVELRMPVLLITGREDDIVNNQLTMKALENSRCRVVQVDVSAAGHYVHDLQYQYFLWALNHWTVMGTAPPRTARVSVAELGSGELSPETNVYA